MESPSQRVIEVVARKEGVSPTELSQPLYDSVEGEALDKLFARKDAKGNGSVQVSFEYHGYKVHVADGDGTDVVVRLS